MSSTKILNGKIEKKGRSFSLIDEPWIPVLDANGQERSVGLRDLFERAEELVDLASGPLETIALYRLFVCIAQRALDGPADNEGWKKARGVFIRDSIAYLERWKSRFDLFGEFPFLQVRGLESDNRKETDKLDFGLTCGNSSTLFDQNAVEGGRVHEPSWLALKLLTFQAFSPGGLIGIAVYRGKKTGVNTSSEGAPCIESSMLITLLKGKNLAENIWLNIVPADRLGNMPLGKPVWEYDDFLDENKEEISCSWLGRLASLARFIELEEDGRQMILANGVSYSKLWGNASDAGKITREPMGTIVAKTGKKSPEWKYVRTDPERSPWRDLGAVLARKQQTKAGSLALENIAIHLNEVDPQNKKFVFKIFVGGLNADKAKIIDAASWNLEISSDIYGDRSLSLYESGVERADSAEKRLVTAIKTYCDSLKEESQKEGLRSKTSLVIRAKKHFWSSLEQQRSKLEDCASNDSLDKWLEIVTEEMKSTYEFVCPRNTARQMQAYAVGLRRLYCVSKKREPKVPAEDKSKPAKAKKKVNKRE